MGLRKRTANILVAIAAFLFLVWGTRAVVFLGELQAGTLPVPAFHLGMVVSNLAIAAYLGYLGVRGRSARGSGAPSASGTSRAARVESRVE